MSKEPILAATISYDGEYYIYKPCNLDICRVPRLRREVKKRFPPHMLERRTFSHGRVDVNELLSKYGIEKYDLWKLVELTEGRIQTDDLAFLTENRLRHYNLSHILN